MSLILEALRRADSERSTTPVAGRGDAHNRDTRMRRPLPMTTLVLINLTVFLAGAALAMWLLRSVLGLTAPAPTATAAAATPVPALAKPAAQRRPVTKPASPPPAQIQSPPPQTAAAAVAPASVEMPVDRTSPNGSTTSGIPEPAPEPATEPDSSVDPDAYASLDDIAPLYASPYDASSDWQPEAEPGTTPSRAAQRRQTPTLDPAAFASALAQQPAAGTQDDSLIHSEPQLRDMPAAYRAQFPSLTIQVHVYDDDPQRRWVLVDGRRYSEGSTLEAGPELVSIETDGIVLSFRGESIWWPLQR
ncbi:hypothetical protein E4T66_04130 [Sinimarinibacterium sp. CAU 1509]|uniref:general secretion pathway protein GspB n=1 Tax=Sinimarinibacterium sp. CAU 1509 TaxID=2562283 RepID=UPI0010AB9523|nr:general secretion pathway protein GspB [Sinimarinibacterium sp. CAU 1509]TJY62913.1 hypothetical protein E4T66_04130 [Sinimarinibacterium sp. CAU 1509]